MAIEEKDLSTAEIVALRWIHKGVATEVWRIEPKSSRDMWGDPIPGMTVFKRLEKKGLCYPTIEDPITFADGEVFEFSPTMELTEEGLAIARKLG